VLTIAFKGANLYLGDEQTSSALGNCVAVITTSMCDLKIHGYLIREIICRDGKRWVKLWELLGVPRRTPGIGVFPT